MPETPVIAGRDGQNLVVVATVLERRDDSLTVQWGYGECGELPLPLAKDLSLVEPGTVQHLALTDYPAAQARWEESPQTLLAQLVVEIGSEVLRKDLRALAESLGLRLETSQEWAQVWAELRSQPDIEVERYALRPAGVTEKPKSKAATTSDDVPVVRAALEVSVESPSDSTPAGESTSNSEDVIRELRARLAEMGQRVTAIEKTNAIASAEAGTARTKLEAARLETEKAEARADSLAEELRKLEVRAARDAELWRREREEFEAASAVAKQRLGESVTEAGRLADQLRKARGTRYETSAVSIRQAQINVLRVLAEVLFEVADAAHSENSDVHALYRRTLVHARTVGVTELGTVGEAADGGGQVMAAGYRCTLGEEEVTLRPIAIESTTR